MSSIELWPSQQNAYNFAIGRDSSALFCEQRTGKTFITLRILQDLIQQEGFCGILIGPLANLVSTWMDKCNEFLPSLGVTKDWEEFKTLKGPRLFLIHFEMLPRMINKLARYKKFNWSCIDEAHRISKRNTKQSKSASRLSWIKRKMILTGTPIEKLSSDLWAQFRYLAPEVWGKNWNDFEDEYMDYPKLNFDRVQPGTEAYKARILQQTILKKKAVISKRGQKKITRMIKPYSFRLTKDDVNIHKPIVTQVIVPLRGYGRVVYETMKKEKVVRLRDRTRIMSELAVTDIVRLRQLASGWVYDEDKNVHITSRSKLRETRRIVDSSKKPVIVFAVHKPELLELQSTLKREGYKVALVYGKIKKSLRPDIWRDFQKAKYDVIVLQSRVGGVGLDLWKSSTTIVYSLGHSFIDWDQLKSRMDNINKTKPSEIFVLCSDKTIDEDLYDLVIEKGMSNTAVLSKLKRKYRNGNNS